MYMLEIKERVEIMNKDKNKRRLKVFGGTLLAIVILFVGIIIWQWDNILSVVYFLKYSENDLEQMDKENKQKLDDVIKELQIEELRELTEDEVQALESGEITQKEAVEISLGKTSLEETANDKTESNASVKNEEAEESNTENTDNTKIKIDDTNVYLVFANSGNQEHEWRYNWKVNKNNYRQEKDEQKPEIDMYINPESSMKEEIYSELNNDENNKKEEKEGITDNSKLADLIAELYVLKSSYISKLSGLEAQGKSEYSSTPEKQRTSSWKATMISKYTGVIAAWEGECDAKVEGVISKIKEEIKRTGGDMSVINTIRSTYEKEKQLKKAGYMNTYLN